MGTFYLEIQTNLLIRAVDPRHKESLIETKNVFERLLDEITGR